MIAKAEHAMCGEHVQTKVVSQAIVKEWLQSIRAATTPPPEQATEKEME